MRDLSWYWPMRVTQQHVFTYNTAAKGAEPTLLHVNSNHWHVAEITPDSALPPIDAIWEHHSRTMRVLNATLTEP